MECIRVLPCKNAQTDPLYNRESIRTCDGVMFGVPPRARAGVVVQSLGGTGPIRAGHVPCPDMTSNLSRVGPLADRPAPPATWLADGNLRLAMMRAVQR